MEHTLVDGRAIASDLLREVHARVSLYGRVPVVRAITVTPSPATESYLRIKVSRAKEAGMDMRVVTLSSSAGKEEVTAAIRAPGADAVIIQLPVPNELHASGVLEDIPLEKDADVLSSVAYAHFERDEPDALIPPVAAAVREILNRAHVALTGARVVVVGRGQLVGKPVATLLAREGGLVTSLSKDTPEEEKAAALRAADIIVSGTGVTHLITPSMVKEGVVLVDAGTSGSQGGVQGDIHPDCAGKASVFTPVPGGVGPVAVTFLFKNTMTLLERLASR